MQAVGKELRRIIRAFGYSLEGVLAAWKTESAFRTEIYATAILLPVSFLLEVTAAERAVLVGSLFLVLIAELANSAVEAVVNRISTEIHPLSKRAKDIGSAMVLVALVNAAFVWLIVLI